MLLKPVTVRYSVSCNWKDPNKAYCFRWTSFQECSEAPTALSPTAQLKWLFDSQGVLTKPCGNTLSFLDWQSSVWEAGDWRSSAALAFPLLRLPLVVSSLSSLGLRKGPEGQRCG